MHNLVAFPSVFEVLFLLSVEIFSSAVLMLER